MTRILLVDGDRRQRELFRLQFSSDGYEIVAVATGKEAYNKLREARIDVVILEPKLPDMCGLRLMSEILSTHRNLSIIVCTAYGCFRDSFMSWAADAFVDKSYDSSELRQALNELVAAKKVASPKKASANESYTTASFS
jgi:CheY-like chemotaxis protein